MVVAVGAGLSATRHAELLRAPGGAIAAFGEGYGRSRTRCFGGYGATFAVMALNFFILTTLDTATRLGRYLLAGAVRLGEPLPGHQLVVVAPPGRWP